MPVVSRAQNAAMWAAKEGHSTLGIPQSVGADFVAASHGMSVNKLPQHVKNSKPAKKHKRPAIFGSLVPHQANHYEAGVNPDGGTDG